MIRIPIRTGSGSTSTTRFKRTRGTRGAPPHREDSPGGAGSVFTVGVVNLHDGPDLQYRKGDVDGRTCGQQ
jgi:hypothetical protein